MMSFLGVITMVGRNLIVTSTVTIVWEDRYKPPLSLSVYLYVSFLCRIMSPRSVTITTSTYTSPVSSGLLVRITPSRSMVNLSLP